jgi:hypothetical protein
MVVTVRVPVVHATDRPFQRVSFVIEGPPGGITDEAAQWGIDDMS